jgi:hypothetical protein
LPACGSVWVWQSGVPADELLPDEATQIVPVRLTTAVLPVMLTDPVVSPRTDPSGPGGNYVRQDAEIASACGQDQLCGGCQAVGVHVGCIPDRHRARRRGQRGAGR